MIAPPTARRPDIPALTSLRFFAAVVVVMFHAGYGMWQGFLPSFVKAWFASGYEAVTFFFVLSGFVLAYVYSDSDSCEGVGTRLDHGRFLKARFVRLAPAYYLGFFLALPQIVYEYFVSNVISTAEFAYGVVLMPLFLHAWYPPAALVLNHPSWSLSVEFFFYALFPLLIHLANRFSLVRFLVLASVVAAVAFGLQKLAISALAEGRTVADAGARFAYYFPPLHLGAFIAGVGLARLFLFGRRLSPRLCDVSFCLSVLAAAGLFGLRGSFPEGMPWSVLIIPLFGALVYFAASSGLANRALGARWLLLLGEASYPLYILHVPIMFWIYQFRKLLPAGINSQWQSFFVTPLIAIAVAVVVTVFFERRARAFLKRRLIGE